MDELLEEMFSKHPCLETCKHDIATAFDMLLDSFRAGGKVLVCGNGGSAADAEHICGELLKKFRKHRAVPGDVAAKLRPELVAKLEGSIPAISLVSMSGVITAFANDVSWEAAFAQQVLGLAKPYISWRKRGRQDQDSFPRGIPHSRTFLAAGSRGIRPSDRSPCLPIPRSPFPARPP